MNERRAIAETFGLEEKVAHLKRTEAYPDKPARVDTIETHFAWVFLTDRFVYKLKKPIRFHDIDFTTLEKRRRNCELEVSLNRRLAEDVYIGTVPLGRCPAGLELNRSDRIVEWLVQMHRLPEHDMLDTLAVQGRVGRPELQRLLTKLERFYRTTARAHWTGPEYRNSLAEQVSKFGNEIAVVADGIGLTGLNRLVSKQLRFIDDNAALLEERIAAGHVVDAHGDLRPEHVYLGEEPQIIDCLEFSAELRLLDTAEEISFLDLECERLGRPDLGPDLIELYRHYCEDSVDAGLYYFYRSRRGLARALVSAWHLQDGAGTEAAEHWIARSNWYLDIARSDLARATG